MSAYRKLLALLPLACLGATWPTNVVLVSDNAADSECTALNTPYDCCGGSGGAGNPANVCDGDGLNSDDVWRALLVCAYGSDRAVGGVADTGGCILDLGVGTINSAEVTLADNHTIEGRSGGSFGANTNPFPNGLDIMGHGRQTILKSSIPYALITGSNNSTLNIFWIENWDPTGAPTSAYSRIRFRNFECDGQSQLQSAPAIVAPGYGFPVRDMRNLLGNAGCIGTRSSLNGDNAGAFHPLVVIEDIYAHNFVGTAFGVGMVGQARIRGNTVSDIGCMQDVDNTICDAGPGPNEQCAEEADCTGPGVPYPCCVGANDCSDPGDCIGVGNPTPCCTGFGTGSSDCDDLTIGGATETCCDGAPANNHTCTPLLCCTGAAAGCNNFIADGDQQNGWILNESVQGEIECGCGAGDPGDCRGWNVEPNFNPGSGIVGEKSPNIYGIIVSGPGTFLVAGNTISRVNKYSLTTAGSTDPADFRGYYMARVHRNTIFKGRMEVGTHFYNSWYSNNTLNVPGMEGEHCNELAGIGSNGAGGRLWIIDNVINPSACHGIDLQHRQVIKDMKRSLRIEGNQINNITGAWLSAATGGTDEGRAIRIQANEVSVGTGCLVQTLPNWPKDIEIINNTVGATFSGRRALDIENDVVSDHSCPGTQNRLTLVDGSYINGTEDVANIANIFATPVIASDVTLNGAAGATTMTFESGSTGTCDDFTTVGTVTITNAGSVVLGNGGDCEL